MDYGKALKAVFEDKNWIGVILIGGALGLVSLFLVWTIIVPLLASAVLYGYMMQYIRDVRYNPDADLPDWTDWGKKLTDGFKLMVVQLIWSLPIFLFLIPTLLPFSLIGLYPDSDILAVIISLTFFAMVILVMIYGLILLFLMPAITINLAVREDFSAGLEFETIFRITKTHFVDILIITILLYGISYIASWIGILLFFVGVFFASFWMMLVKGHLYGQLARLAIPVANPDDTPLPTSAETKPLPVTD